MEEMATNVARLKEQLHSAHQEAAQLNARERLLGRPVTDYSQLKALTDTFDPFLHFWTSAAAWKVRTKSMGVH